MIGLNPKEKGSLADAKALVTVMTDAEQIFERFPDFIREFIYANSWESLRSIQISAAKTLFETDHHLLLTSATASGKTEAAFFPILTDLWENPPFSVGALYIAPLKSLINDQFYRMDDLLRESGITVTHWHGDVSMSHKRKLLENPKGILQITPESLEAMLINRPNDLLRLFGDLRYVVIDEVHTLIGSDRGNQIICQLVRLAERIGHTRGGWDFPRPWGTRTSLPIGSRAAPTARPMVPLPPKEKIHWRLGLEHFYIQNLDENQDPAIRTGETPAALTRFRANFRKKRDSRPTRRERTIFRHPLRSPGHPDLFHCPYRRNKAVTRLQSDRTISGMNLFRPKKARKVPRISRGEHSWTRDMNICTTACTAKRRLCFPIPARKRNT